MAAPFRFSDCSRQRRRWLTRDFHHLPGLPSSRCDGAVRSLDCQCAGHSSSQRNFNFVETARKYYAVHSILSSANFRSRDFAVKTAISRPKHRKRGVFKPYSGTGRPAVEAKAWRYFPGYTRGRAFPRSSMHSSIGNMPERPQSGPRSESSSANIIRR